MGRGKAKAPKLVKSKIPRHGPDSPLPTLNCNSFVFSSKHLIKHLSHRDRQTPQDIRLLWSESNLPAVSRHKNPAGVK